MPVKIRLQRHGKKGKPFFWIVAADSRSKRDGKFLEKLGTYNPTTNPAQIDLDVNGTVKWLQNGAQPTDTARAILSYKGAMMKNHLTGGLRKGALTEEQVENKFNEWLENKIGSIDHKKEKLSDAKEKDKAERLAAEKVINVKRIADAEAANAPVEETTEATEEVATENTTITEEESTDAAENLTEQPSVEDEAVETEAETSPTTDPETTDAAEKTTEQPPVEEEAVEAESETATATEPDTADAAEKLAEKADVDTETEEEAKTEAKQEPEA